MRDQELLDSKSFNELDDNWLLEDFSQPETAKILNK